MVNASDRSILAVHPGALGDVVLLGHLLRGLGGRAVLVAGGQKARLLAGLGAAAEAKDFDSLPMHEVFSTQPVAQCRLPEFLGPCDWLLSAFAAGDPPAQVRLASLVRAGEAIYLPVRPPPGFGGHLLDLWRERMGLPAGREAAPWLVPRAWRQEARRLLAEAGIEPAAPYWVIHPGAGSPAKCWPLERFLDLARRPAAEGRFGRAVLVWGPAEEERWGRRQRELCRRFPIVSCPPLSALAGLLAGATVSVGNDSGVSHLSAAVGAATATLFAAPGVRHFAPRGPRARVVSAEALEDIPPERVLEAMEALPNGPR